MNIAYKKNCVHCAHYDVNKDECKLFGMCEFVRLTKKKIRYRRKSKDIFKDLLGKEVQE